MAMLMMNKSGPKFLFPMIAAGLLLLATGVLSSACNAPRSREDLHPEGPPMVEQVIMTEQISATDRREGQLAFGSHSAPFFAEDDGEVLNAVTVGSQEIRVILDELVRGNDIEEVACADSTFSRIPYGTTPDDFDRCSGPPDSLTKCDSLCLNPSDGTPIGILDEDEDGAPDKLRMIDYNDDPDVVELAVKVTCDGVDIPLDQNFSFWSPSGNQTFPSNDVLGFRGLGPALVLKPLGDKGLRTSASCSIAFRPEVVDYDGNTVCAPAGGDINGSCSDGDTSQISFGTDSLVVVNTVPTEPAPSEVLTNVGVSESGFMIVGMNGYIDVDTVSAITITANGVDVPIIPATDAGFIGDDKTLISFKLADDFLPDSDYVMTIGTGLKDVLGGSLAAEKVVKWSTEGLALLSSSVNDGATGVGPAPIELDFNGVVLASSFGAIRMTRDGTPTGDGTPATDGTNVAVSKTLKSGDGSIVEVDLGNGFAINTYYELLVTTDIKGREGGSIAADQLFTFTSEGFALRSSTPADTAVDVAIAGGDITLTFNAEVDPASVTAITLTADGTDVAITPVVQADAHQVLINVGTDFAAGAAYQLTISADAATGLKEVGGTIITSETFVNWTTAN